MLLVASGAVLHAAEPTLEQSRFFETKIRPLLAKRCFSCHGEKKQEGELRLDSRVAMLKGGESDAALVPGKPAESLLVEAIAYEGLEMPPSGQLNAAQIRLLVRWIEMGAPWPEGSGESLSTAARISDEDRSYWAFRPVGNPKPPDVNDGNWCRNDVDRFIYRRLSETDLSPAPPADRATLIRRLYFDLVGIPPSPQEVDAFVEDTSPEAYALLVDRLLDSPHYGERWGRHWLDLVRYAESDGYRADGYRANAWHYRDYVIRCFNDDKPYDQFLREQLAGDELAPDDPDVVVATAFLRHGVYEHNQRDARMHWSLIMDEMTDVTGEVILGMSVGCARCHDHKFDPILQEDYFRLQAFFAPVSWHSDVPMATPGQRVSHNQQLVRWEEMTSNIRDRIDQIERPHIAAETTAMVKMFPDDIQVAYRKRPEERTSFEQQMAYLVHRQVLDNRPKYEKRIKDEQRKEWEALHKDLTEFDKHKPKSLPALMTVRDIARPVSPTIIPGDLERRSIEPGFLTVLDGTPATIDPVETAPASTGRRAALARWYTRPEHPLTGRVITNRIWQWHFGSGIVATPSEFGQMGEQPTHPELLDYLTRRLIDSGWKLKDLHRLIVTSATYQQAADHPNAARQESIDPENKLRWRSSTRRLDSDQIRDAMLAATGELDRKVGGPSVKDDKPRRSVYLKVMRNTPDPVLAVFDVADSFLSTAQRDVTTTPSQALLMINGTYVLKRAEALAGTILQSGETDVNAIVKRAYRLVLGRTPSTDERDRITRFLEAQVEQTGRGTVASVGSATRRTAVTDLCHVLLNSNEFLYVD
ncbi:MAG TPA: PSD1 and planctomycete cytochrome C domain-containing protein [Pirellulaceae bacterium]|nr:PSD1 and planctomycete cytochrome C domain-containing protein [Pirellulaceae bacterium]